MDKFTVGALVSVNETHDNRNIMGRTDDLVEYLHIFIDKSGDVQEVFRGIAGNGQFRENNEMRAAISGAVDKRADFICVILKIAYLWVNLSQRYFHKVMLLGKSRPISQQLDEQPNANTCRAFWGIGSVLFTPRRAGNIKVHPGIFFGKLA